MLLEFTKGGAKACLSPVDVSTALADWDGSPVARLAIPNDIDLARVAQDLTGAEMIDLEFPTFRDGRAYSQARFLRRDYGFSGAICACGDVLSDQLFFMRRCGFSHVALEADHAAASATAALATYRHAYQAAADRVTPVWGLREHARLRRAG